MMISVQSYISENNLLFGSFYIEWIERGLQEFSNETVSYQIYVDAVQSDIIKILYEKLNRIAMRTLIEEMHVCKDMGQLSGKDGCEEYRYYNEVILSNPDYRDRVLKKYPILKSCMDNACYDVIRHIGDMIRRFAQDLPKIENQILHSKVSKITGVHSNLSDSHNKGKSVIRLELDSEKYIIYKPHSIENEAVFQDIVGDIGRELSLESSKTSMICCEGYGWEGYVTQDSSESKEEVQRFFQRIGISLFVSHLLKATDLHQENLIACGEYPIFVDMEALFAVPPSGSVNSIQEQIHRFMKTSVMSTGILPFYHWNSQNQGINVSALSEAKEQISPVRIPVPVELYTSDMHIDYVYGKIPPAKNAVYLNGEKITPNMYIKDVIDGFQRSYELVMTNKRMVMKWILRLQNLYSRYLVADTQKYSLILSTSYHPKLLMNDSGREDLYEKVWPSKNTETDAQKTIHEYEKRDLRQGDVPIFHIMFDGRGLYHEGELIVDNYILASPKDYLLQTLDNLCQKDMQQQVMLIETAMSIPVAQINKVLSVAPEVLRLESVKKENIIKSAVQRILDFAIHTDDEKEIGWLVPQITGKETMRFKTKGMGMYLYDGLAGMLLLFSLLVYKLHYNEYRDVYEKIRNQLFTYTDKINIDMRFVESGRTGIFNGEASVVAVYILAYKVTQDSVYLDKAKQHAEAVKQLLETDRNYDLLDGKTGAILVLSELYVLTQESKYLEWMIETEHALTEAAISTEDEMTWEYPGLPHPLLGMAHGNAGISLAYAKLYEVTGDQKYLECLEKIIRYEHRRYSNQLEDWFDYRNEDYEKVSKEEPAAWCHGAGGILSARLELLHLELPDSLRVMIEKDIQRAVHKLKTSYGRENLCLCHGIGGNLLIMKKYLRYFQDAEMEELCQIGVWYLDECLERGKIDLVREKYGMGLMTGYGGLLMNYFQ